jgi:hypothetical protein
MFDYSRDMLQPGHILVATLSQKYMDVLIFLRDTLCEEAGIILRISASSRNVP